MTKQKAPVADGGDQWTDAGRRSGLQNSFEPIALQVRKHGRLCVIAKLVIAQPLAQLVLAMPFRNRREVEHVSVPLSALAYAREHHARLWLVRLDNKGECRALPLAEVESSGWLRPSDGGLEWFVPLDKFRPIGWQDWPYTEKVITLGNDRPQRPAPKPRQPGLFEVAL